MRYYYQLLSLALSIIFGCEQVPDSANLEMASKEFATPTQNSNAETPERKLIKEGHLEFESDNLSQTRETIFKAVDKYRGYVSSDQEFKAAGRTSNTIVVRVPSENFDHFLKEATQGVDNFDSKEINVKDVTEEFLDIQARLKTKKELEARYIDLLKQAKNVSEILEIEKEIGKLRSEIESVEGRLNYIQNKVSYATLTMIFYKRMPDGTAFGPEFKSAFRNGWDNLIWFFVALANIWPFIVIVTGLIMGVRIYRRKRKK